jgi:gamma-glutamyltranspeptidase/glutathione hydrolase
MYLGTKFAVASESYLATRAGYEVYKAGGNAVDAVVAASAVLTYTLPHLGGVGGDFLALVHAGRVEAVVGFGWAPKRVPKKPPRRGIQSAVVPGYVAGLYELHKRHGHLPWEKVVGFAIAAMEKATMHPSLVSAIEKNADLLARDPGGRMYLELPKMPGSPYRIEPLLKLWRRLRDSPLSFYDEVARDVAELGYFEVEDFSTYKPAVGDALRMEYGEWTIYEAPPPSLGFAVLLALKLAQPAEGPFSYARIKNVVAALKKAHWARDKFLHDGEVPIYDILEGRVEFGEAESPEPTPGTTYLAAADGEVVVSAIQSLYHPFGSGVTEPRWGITFNNRASDFTAGLNEAAPRKRPAHTLSAVVMGRGDEVYALGASAGHYRPAIYVQLIQNIVSYGMDPRQAVWAPRFIWLRGDEVQAEEGWEQGPGVRLVKYPSRMGVAALVARRGKGAVAVADIRGDGLALGE